jgi:hypothetical protein
MFFHLIIIAGRGVNLAFELLTIIVMAFIWKLALLVMVRVKGEMVSGIERR